LCRISLRKAENSCLILNYVPFQVSCRTDTIARDIFSLVVQHMNINEHVFFGLSFMKDGEHFFLEDHQRLEKFAPNGWKNAHKNGLRTNFVLYLRFRFYPQVLDFIKTDVTMHELYLQVRHDVIEERIQPRRDAAYELAALALQAEFGNRPPPVIVDYFDNQHYLPHRYCSMDDPKHLQAVLAEMHGHYSGTKPSIAEHKFIQVLLHEYHKYRLTQLLKIALFLELCNFKCSYVPLFDPIANLFEGIESTSTIALPNFRDK
uniref:FERM domain-containing protein n=1 Tax=Haemonchus placei TaxID=6290 RepID=A0A0N4VW55_HAEPC